jgi:hypothetical protein
VHRVPLFSPPKLQSLKRKGVDSNLEESKEDKTSRDNNISKEAVQFCV